jgi:hypothetical protein
LKLQKTPMLARHFQSGAAVSKNIRVTDRTHLPTRSRQKSCQVGAAKNSATGPQFPTCAPPLQKKPCDRSNAFTYAIASEELCDQMKTTGHATADGGPLNKTVD